MGCAPRATVLTVEEFVEKVAEGSAARVDMTVTREDEERLRALEGYLFVRGEREPFRVRTEDGVVPHLSTAQVTEMLRQREVPMTLRPEARQGEFDMEMIFLAVFLLSGISYLVPIAIAVFVFLMYRKQNAALAMQREILENQRRILAGLGQVPANDQGGYRGGGE